MHLSHVPVIDTHFHLTDDPFFLRREQILDRCRNANITAAVVPAYNTQTCLRAEQIAISGADVFCAVGSHPLFPEVEMDLLRRLCRHPNIYFIGEIGLDRRKNSPPLHHQLPLLEPQLDLAQATDLPVILHCVQAYEELRDAVKRFTDLRGILHRSACSWATARFFVDRGYFFGIGPDILSIRQKKVRELVEKLPLEQIVVETDSPYVRLPNQDTAMPWDLHEVVGRIAEIRRTDPVDTAVQIYENSLRLIGKAHE